MSTHKNIEIEKIGEKIRLFRKEMGMNLIQFADLIGIKHSSLSNIENNKTKPSAETLSKLCIYTNINIEWLLAGEEKERIERNPAENQNQTKTPRFFTPIIGEIEMWLKEATGKEPMMASWFAVELKKKFPEFKEWCEKKRDSLSNETLHDNKEPEIIKKVS
ncbi:MAG: helix-turn-helix transcriptional regulator [Desulfocapsaceae bacterium]|nr:helix-turn-helix transcriptional regulator [Desulfocapsaceae bacterium]